MSIIRRIVERCEPLLVLPLLQCKIRCDIDVMDKEKKEASGLTAMAAPDCSRNAASLSCPFATAI